MSMNDRIRLLAEHAGLNAFPPVMDYDRKETHWTGWDTNLEKFAELIVLACYEHCKGEMLDKEVADTHELTYNDAVMDCSNGLLQHFGIEL